MCIGEGCESKKSKFSGNARAREETWRLFSSSFHPREEQTRRCSFHQSAMRITGGKTLILQHQDSRTKIKQRKKCTFLRFFLSFGLLLPISYRGMVATLCYPTLPSQVFLRGRGKVVKVSGHPPICVNYLNPNRSLERYNATCIWTDNFLSSSIFLLHLVSRSRRSPLRHRQTRNKLLNHQIKSVQDLTTNLD